MARDDGYREAEKRIEATRRSGKTELDLSDLELTELPESLGQLAQLQRLDVDNNQLTALPEPAIRIVTSVRRLNSLFPCSTRSRRPSSSLSS